MIIEAMKQALNALERIEDLLSSMDVTHLLVYGEVNEAITALRAAIESAEKQEPVAWMVYTLDGKSVFVTDNPTDFTDQHRALPLYTTQPVSPVQDPVSWITKELMAGYLDMIAEAIEDNRSEALRHKAHWMRVRGEA